MVRRKSKTGRAGRQGQKWVSTSLSERAHSLTATVAALELDARNLSSTGCQDFKFMNDEDSSVHENVDVTETSTPPASYVDDRDTDDELESEDAPVDTSTTIAQQVQVHLGSNDAHDGNAANDDDTNRGDEPEIKLTPVDCATLNVLKLCHNAEKHFLLPLTFYIDETGTDVFQRHPLEPLMFTLGILRNFLEARRFLTKSSEGKDFM
jgi:hypothetical protein